MLVKLVLVSFLCAAVMAATATPAVAADNPTIVVETSMGAFEIELYADKAPKTVANILGYVDDKFYDGLIFHRVIPTFMVQGGGLNSKLEKKETKAEIVNESTNGLLNKRGTVAMARTPKPNSATSQFFVNTKDNDFLDRANAQDEVGYCVFGKVTKGMDIVDKIKDVKTETRNGMKDVPAADVTIKSIRVKK